MAGIREYLEACRYRQNFLQEQLQWLKQEYAEYGADAERLDEVSQRVQQETVGYLLPEVDDDYLSALQDKLHYPGLLPIKKEYEDRFEAAEARRVELEAMDELQQYEFFWDRAKRDVEDVRPKYDSMKEKLSHWENTKWFWQLEKRGYFKPDYQAGFFRRFFDWRAVSFLMAHLKKKAELSFDLPIKLREHYRLLREEAETVFAAFDKRMAEQTRIENLKAEHQEMLTAPERLLAELFRDLGEAALAHLNACPEDLRLEIARSDSHLNAFLRKQIGTQKQAQYLRELAVTRINSRIQQVEQELHKVDAKIRKLKMQQRRGKRKRYSRDDLFRMRNVKADKWKNKRAKTTKIRHKIVKFNKYDRGSCSSGYLWWDLITNQSHADDIYEVREFRRTNPDWDYRAYRDPTTTGVADQDHTGVFDDVAEDLASSMSTMDDELYLDAS